MIDTIRFQIDIDEKLYNKIRSKSVELSKRNNELDTEFIRILSKELNVGSYDRHINIRIFEENQLYLEFSLPKIFFGHNVYMIAPEQIFYICGIVRRTLAKMFGFFPYPEFWRIKRIDLCYAWKLPSEYVAEQILGIFRGITICRKKSHFYDTSVMWYGRTQSFKFYLKHPEFYEHDFKELKKSGLNDLAYQFLAISEGVLRFEVTLRNIAITRVFCDDKLGNFIYLSEDFFTTEKVQKILQKFLYKVFRLSSVKTMDNKTVYDKLQKCYGTTQARHIYTFYKLLFSPDSNEKSILKTYTRMQTWRYIKKLRDCEIGISSDQVQIGFDLKIPSDYVINSPIPAR